MAYVDDITEPLISTLTHTAGLSAPLLAGHAANLEFWMGEVQHAFHVIDGYRERFKKLQEGQRSAAEESRRSHEFGKPIRPAVTDHELKLLRGHLVESVSLLLRRCYTEGLVSETTLDEYCEKFALDSLELKRKKKS